jgi:antitoxin VapB
MRVEIDDPEFDQAVKELAAATGEPEDISLKVAVKERLDRVTHRKGREFLERIREIQDRVAEMPELDPRPADEIIGYNEHGAFD